jgi:hypothetical protein
MFLVLRTLVYVTSRSSAHSTPPRLVIREPRHYKHPTPPGLKMSKLQRPPRARRAATQELSQVCQCRFNGFLRVRVHGMPKLPALLLLVACAGVK